jgi:uncharacterized ferredoxin-like protein
MEISARTAPKAKGEDYVVVRIVEGESLRRLGEDMIAYGERIGKDFFGRDGRCILNSAAVLLVGLKDARPSGLNCTACGSPTCVKPNTVEGQFRGPNCAMRLLDMGIAVGSAVKTAGILNVDNRVFYTAGPSARELGLIDADIVIGIPLSVTGKSIYFDR